MAKYLTNNELRKLLRKRQGDRTAKEFAQDLGISAGFLCDIYQGKRDPGEKALATLGLQKLTVYVQAA